MDSINKKIIRILSENSRITVSELSKLVHLSAPAVKERIEKLEQQRAILAYSLKTEPEALGYAISGFVQANVIPGREAQFKQMITSSLSITECYNVTGEKAFVFRVSVRTMSELDELLESLSSVCKTETSLILSETISPRLPLSFR
ncbi:MAG: Lrp/AsnC family transcriptional regulator [Pseudomonadales bacterium]|nr:Lrp/AsnC family transcriptional regulator [Pseudomonadales bacterium]MCJ8341189.1 Lrp/AsnC family transcriptional regulator [Pseudomonadales bacterium]NRA14882.1 Lrp/AsnC family transcriptional regulator [Oceanospirillaceae bacterium]